MSEQIITTPTTVRHHIGRCPGCGVGLYAEVDVVTQVHAPRLDSNGKAQDCAHAVIVGSHIVHTCERVVDGEWVVGR